jgi:hypothetical protein
MPSSPTSVSPLRSPPPHADAPVEQVGKVAAALGVSLYPWQQRAVATGLAPGRRRVVVSTPRRAGKTTLVSTLLTWRCLTLPDARCWYTAQTQASASDWWRLAYIDTLAASPVLAGRYHHRRSAGTEHTAWPNGSMLRVFAPDGDKIHGNDADLVVVDEAWRIPTSHGEQLAGAADPAGLRRPHYSMWVVSTVGSQPVGWLYDLMQNPDADVLHYGCPADVDPFDPDAWPTWHPGYEDPDPAFRRQLTEVLTVQARDLPESEFRRAYANQWPTTSTAGRITPTVWEQLQGDVGDRGDLLHVAFDTSWDRSMSTVVASWMGEDDRARVEVVANRPGVTWLVRYLADVWERLGARPHVDSGSPARDVTRALQNSGIPVVELSTGDYAAACARFTTAALNQQLLVRPDPVLDVAVAAGERRNIGDRWVWDRRRALDLSPLTAATVAAWPVLTPNAEPLLLGT